MIKAVLKFHKHTLCPLPTATSFRRLRVVRSTRPTARTTVWYEEGVLLPSVGCTCAPARGSRSLRGGCMAGCSQPGHSRSSLHTRGLGPVRLRRTPRPLPPGAPARVVRRRRQSQQGRERERGEGLGEHD